MIHRQGRLDHEKRESPESLSRFSCHFMCLVAQDLVLYNGYKLVKEALVVVEFFIRHMRTGDVASRMTASCDYALTP
jgi:hypothetical protein